MEFKRATDFDPATAPQFQLCPKYEHHELTDKQIEDIAERAANKAVIKAKNEFYQGVGVVVVTKIYWLVGAVCVGLIVFGIRMGWVKP
jgi:hypothetical protein